MSLAWRGREWTHPGPWKPAPRPRAPQHLSGEHEQREDTSETVRSGKAHQGQGGCTFDTHSQNASFLLQTLLNSGFLTTLNHPAFPHSWGGAVQRRLQPLASPSGKAFRLQEKHGRTSWKAEAPAGAVWSSPAAAGGLPELLGPTKCPRPEARRRGPPTSTAQLNRTYFRACL